MYYSLRTKITTFLPRKWEVLADPFYIGRFGSLLAILPTAVGGYVQILSTNANPDLVFESHQR